jgi:hypothetical protein
LNTRLISGGTPIGVDRGGQRLDDQRADHRCRRGEPAAGQRGAADDDREDRVQLDQQPALLPSALLTLELIISPAMPAHSAQNT